MLAFKMSCHYLTRFCVDLFSHIASPRNACGGAKRKCDTHSNDDAESDVFGRTFFPLGDFSRFTLTFFFFFVWGGASANLTLN